VYGGDFMIIHGTAARWRAADDPTGHDPLTWLETEAAGASWPPCGRPPN
jgi:hypothetical protein